VAVLHAAARMGLFDLLEVTVAGDPYLKRDEGEIMAASVRLEMAVAAFAHLPLVEVSDRELRREGPTYTIDTVRELLGAGDVVDLIVGADLVGQLPSWHEADELARLVRVGVVPRPGGEGHLATGWHGYEIPMEPVDLSSTFIREISATEADLRPYLPDDVIPLYLRWRG
jgi:nicotinate-nucleotide adenylyltransferase